MSSNPKMLSIDRCTLYDSEIKLLILLPYVILKYLRMIVLYKLLYIDLFTRRMEKN